ncbi:Cell adhesion molecule [Apis cerana cerana]|uniref:Cell adhesion molecule n=1 Tax=Apis cerana cerana TaxID=94128 RepID=A0A2A3EB65_APICC|nr:Cell adhesion molecule [Apis cerana cerana]
MHCNHSVPDEFLHKVEFMKDDKRILQYIKDRKPPFHRGEVEGASMEVKLDSYTSIAIITELLVPQTENPKITFKKNSYVVGESLEANCTSSAAHPVPHLTWYINGKEVSGYQSGKSLSSHTPQKPTDVRYCEAGDRGFRIAHRKKRSNFGKIVLETFDSN